VCRARREAERIQRELEEREQEELKAYMASRGKKVGEGEKLDAKAINREVMSEQLKQQQELQRKLAKLAKQMDHLERARREEEAPLLVQAYEHRIRVSTCVCVGGGCTPPWCCGVAAEGAGRGMDSCLTRV
jgi:translation initiation factor 3 subunit A